jgi:hypothetical protein
MELIQAAGDNARAKESAMFTTASMVIATARVGEWCSGKASVVSCTASSAAQSDTKVQISHARLALWAVTNIVEGTRIKRTRMADAAS